MLGNFHGYNFCGSSSPHIITKLYVQMEINFVLGKNGAYIPSSLGGRSIGVGRQAVRQKIS